MSLIERDNGTDERTYPSVHRHDNPTCGWPTRGHWAPSTTTTVQL